SPKARWLAAKKVFPASCRKVAHPKCPKRKCGQDAHTTLFPCINGERRTAFRLSPRQPRDARCLVARDPLALERQLRSGQNSRVTRERNGTGKMPVLLCGVTGRSGQFRRDAILELKRLWQLKPLLPHVTHRLNPAVG